MNDRINEHYYGDLCDPQTVRCRARLHWICAQVQGGKILDIGCSQGIVCLILAREGFECTGVDIDDPSLQFANAALQKESEIVRRRVIFRPADGTALPFPDASFDSVILGEVIEHLTQPARILREVRRVLKQGGKAIITVPHGLNAYPDHKHSYYPISLLLLTQPFFKPEFLATLDGYVAFTGSKDIEGAQLSERELLAYYQRLEPELEQRCVLKEQNLLETGTRLYAQLKSQSLEIENLKKLTRAHEEIPTTHKPEQAPISDSSEVDPKPVRPVPETSSTSREVREEQEEPANRLVDNSELLAAISKTETELRLQSETIREVKLFVGETEQKLMLHLRNSTLESIARTEATERALAQLQNSFFQAQEPTAALASNGAAENAALATLSSQMTGLSAEIAAIRRDTDRLQESVARSLEERENKIGDPVQIKAEQTPELIEKARTDWLKATESKFQVLRDKLTELQRIQQETLLKATDEMRRDMLAQQRAKEADLRQFRKTLDALASRLSSRPMLAEGRNGLLTRVAGIFARPGKRANGSAVEQSVGQAEPANASSETELVREIRKVAVAALPADAKVIVISKGDDYLLNLSPCIGWHFPQTAEGTYAGYHPANSEEAIAHLEQLRAKGAGYLLIPATSFWWLDFYGEFRQHLESLYRLLAYHEDTCLLFALSAPASDKPRPLALSTLKRTGSNGHGHASPFLKSKESKPQPVDVKTVSSTQAKPVVSKPVVANGASAHAPAGSKPSASSLSPLLNVGGILDEFTAACFRPECNLISFRPDNWRSMLERSPLDLLFVESAWQGNGGSWQYKIASFKKPMGEELVELIEYCKAHKIPTVFWNKEDPSHFERFKHQAPLFDFVFTTDADMVSQYRDIVKHDRVFALPFAAQAKLHNPIVEANRADNVCFAGAYYALDHDERRADLDHILRPALAYGLHIYDRQHGVVGTNAAAYQFPEIYRSAIKGRLEYDQMIKAYKRYKVFLNVNSVKHSPTMFSRRVFELLASGTPVVSSFAKGIVEILGTDIVHLASSEAETRQHLERLLYDDAYWSAVSVKGIREVFSRHTYGHRFAEICRRVGLRIPTDPSPRIGAVARLNSTEELTRLTGNLVRQTYRDFALTLIIGQAVDGEIEKLKRALPDIPVRILPSGTDLVQCLRGSVDTDYLWLVNLEDTYGQDFLKDSALAAVYSNADVIGKHTHLEISADGGGTELASPGHEYRSVKSVSPGSLLAKPGKLSNEQWRALATNRFVVLQGLQVLSIDRHNYVRGGSKLEHVHEAANEKGLVRIGN